MPAVVSSDRWTTTFIHGEKILTGFSIPRRFIWRSLELRESVNWVLDSFEREKMLTGFLIPRSFIEREKIWTRLSIPRSSIERSLGCILSETARKPNYRFSVRPKPKSWLSVEKGSWYDDHDKSIHCFLRTGHDLHRCAAFAVLLPCYPCHCHWQWVLFPDLMLYLYLCPMSLSIPLFWINLSFVLIFSTINPPLMTYCIPDTKQRQHCHHLCHGHHHHCHHQHRDDEATVHRNRPAKGISGAAWCVRLTPLYKLWLFWYFWYFLILW